MSKFDNLAKQVVMEARESGVTIAVAESCTGGGIGRALTDIPGASHVFLGGVIAYHNDVKTGLLGVDASMVSEFGAVSAQVAMEMAENVRALTGSVLGMSVTGIAGPGGGSAEKPVGLVYLGLAESGVPTQVTTCRFGSIGRDEVRQKTIEAAFSLLGERVIKS